MRTAWFCTPLITGILAALATAHAPAASPEVIRLWPGEPPGETRITGPERELEARPGARQVLRLTDVSAPSLAVYPAPEATANGTAVVVCPGGGYSILAMDLEGTEIAQWLNSLGVTAIVLKYRVPTRDQAAPHAGPLADAQRAIRLVRSQADRWSLDPARVGMLGFSAGGHLTVMAGTQGDAPAYEAVDGADQLDPRPSFLIPIYPAYLLDTDSGQLAENVTVDANTPPTFIAITHDDAERPIGAALLYAALKRAGVPAELHIFLRGGHGYGLRPSEDTVSTWPQLCAAWMQSLELLP